MFISLAVIFCLITGGFGVLISTPSNVAVLKDQNFSLTCSSDNIHELLWYAIYINATNEKLIAVGTNVTSSKCFCSVQRIDNKYTVNLLANELTVGRYRCVERYNINNYETAQVIVFDSNPICDIDDENFICSVTYGGFWHPIIEISTMEGIILNTSTMTQPYGNKTNITAVFPKDNIDYICTIKFVPFIPRETTAKNIPNNFSCTWPKNGTTRKGTYITKTPMDNLSYIRRANGITLKENGTTRKYTYITKTPIDDFSYTRRVNETTLGDNATKTITEYRKSNKGVSNYKSIMNKSNMNILIGILVCASILSLVITIFGIYVYKNKKYHIHGTYNFKPEAEVPLQNIEVEVPLQNIEAEEPLQNIEVEEPLQNIEVEEPL